MSNNTGRTLMTELQVDKYANVNTQLGVIDAAITEVLDLDFSGGNVTLTTSEFNENVCFVTGADLSVARVLNTPATPNKKMFLVDNALGTADCTVTTGSTTVVVSAGDNGLFYTDGTTDGLLQVAGGGAGGGGGNTDDLDWKASVRVASTANVVIASALEDGDSLDGITLAEGDRVLLKNQTSADENGIYVVVAVAAGAASRSSDADSATEINAGMTVYVEEGTENAQQFYVLVTTGAIVVDTTNLSFELWGEGPTPYDIGGSFGGTIASNEVIMRFIAVRDIRIPANAAGSHVESGVAALAQTDIDMQAEGVSFGTIRFAASGTVATFVSVSEQDFAAGEEFELVGPGTADTNLADLVFTFAGFRIGGS